MNRVNKTINKKKSKGSGKTSRVIALILITALVFSFIPSYSGSAASNYMAVTSREAEPQKREVVYGKLAADGRSEKIFVVNHFDLSEMQSFIDHGDYSDVLQLTGENAPQLESGEVKLRAAAGSYYYQGNLKSRELPWLINISYQLDGQDIPAAETAGVEGELFIKISIKANPAVNAFFFEHYALQVSASLSPDKARLLETNDGATVAINGEDRVVNWLVFPGQEADLFLRLQVENFEMDAISFAGVSLDFDFDFEVGELSDETEGLKELSDGIGQLADGAKELEAAVIQLQDGLGEIETGSSELADNGSQLSQGAGELQNAFVQLEQGVTKYTGGVTSIKYGMSNFSSGLKQLRDGVAQLAGNGASLSGGSAEILSALQKLAAGLNGGSDLEEAAAQLPTEAEMLQLEQLIQGSAEFKAALDQLASAAAGINDLYTGMKSLEDSLAYMSSEAGKFVLPELPFVARNAEQWKAHLEGDYGISLTEDAWNGLLTELLGLSSMAEAYVSAVQILQGTLAMLNNAQEGVPALTDGVEQLLPLAGGISYLAQNYGEIHEGLVLLGAKVDDLSALSDDLPAMLIGLSELEAGINLLVSEYANFDSGLSDYTQGVSQLLAVFDGTAERTGLTAGANQLQAGLNELDVGSASLTSGMKDYSAGLAEYKQGVDTYVGGAFSLSDGIETFNSEGLDKFAQGFGTYTEGALEFKEATANIQVDFLEQLDQAIAEFTDMDFEPRSFVSEENKNVASVQFVLLTEAISIAEENNGPTFEPEIKGDFLSRLRALFIKGDE